MSLINQALKKEQLRRSTTPDLSNVPLPPAHRALVAKQRNNDKNTKVVIGVCAIGATLLVAIVMASIAGVKRVFNGVETSIAKVQPSEAEPIHPLNSQMAAATLPEEPTTITEAETPPPTNETTPPIAQEEVPPPAPKADPRIQQYLEGINFQAVRLAKENSRLLLGGRVYQIGNIIGNDTIQLLFTGVEGSTLVFKGPDGASYRLIR